MSWTAPTPAPQRRLREGLAETLTISRLGVPPTLARTLRSTNYHRVDDRRSAATTPPTSNAGTTGRWCCAGPPPEWARPAKQFRRVNGYLHLPALRAALDATTAVTPSKEDAAA